ncbi:hypothetical protein F1559_002758 [Cyanidiococcus yangmingshanensis]|uniref:Ubiquitin-like domain-containing protein n=1 Tax=Cyanidiococcus yangmingshanensis TaxID=2690220 RepID=A0A7J7IDC9_9RHOD|nr:hypothetical protein F1559_002758 [Cyanidiococcus yangmingshanensis]
MDQTDSLRYASDSAADAGDRSATSSSLRGQTAGASDQVPRTVGLVRILLKTPTMTTEPSGRSHILLIEPECTVAALKQKICLEHPVHPPPEQQRLVYAGRLLRDEERIHQIVGLSWRLPELFPANTSESEWSRFMSTGTSASTSAGTSSSSDVYAVFHLVVAGHGATVPSDGPSTSAHQPGSSVQQPESPSRTETNSIPSTNSGEVMTFSEASRERLGSVSDAERSPAPSLTTRERLEGSTTEVSAFDASRDHHDDQGTAREEHVSTESRLSIRTGSATNLRGETLSATTADGHTRPLTETSLRSSATPGTANVLLRLDEQTLQLMQAYTRMVRAYEDYNRCLTEYYAVHEAGSCPPPHWLAGRGHVSSNVVHHAPPGSTPQSVPNRTGLRPAERDAVSGVIRAPGAVGVPVRLVAIRIRIPALDWALIVKLAFMVILLGQDAGRDRLLLLIGLAVLIYLFQTGMLGPIRRYFESFSSQLMTRVQAAAGLGASVGSTPSQGTGTPTSSTSSRTETVSARVLRFLRAFYVALVAFVCSLFPTWRPPTPPRPAA